ncbi:MAG TPA: hypothetical protein VGK67_39325 [Myxococcales bacterium]|jgi:hypothetical protein
MAPAPKVTIDAARFPRLASYMAALPLGFESYPDCRIKGFYFRESLQALKAPAEIGAGWPQPLQDLLAAPPTNSAFMPEVLYCAFRLCVADHLHMTQPAYEEWVLGNSRSIYKGFVGKLIMAFASKAMLLDAAGSRWAMIHRGSTFQATTVPGTSINRGVLQFPPHLFNEMILRGLGGVMKAAFELVEKQPFQLVLVEFNDRMARYEALPPAK